MRRRKFGNNSNKLNATEIGCRIGRMKCTMLHAALHKTVKANAQYLHVQ